MTASAQKDVIRVGAGAGFSGDRIEPAVELARDGDLDFLVFECLAERTIALAQRAKKVDPNAGYDPLFEARMLAVLPICRAKRVRIVTNMGAANPRAAALRLVEMAREMGLPDLVIGVVEGDDVLETLTAETPVSPSLAHIDPCKILSANAYLGAAGLVEALDGGADVVICGRVADPALFLAPLIHTFRWAFDDWDRLGQGTLIGHLLECAGQVTGGYFADPGVKDVSDLARLGFPLAEVSADGGAVLQKVVGSGGAITVQTCTEQLLYEIGDPTAYLTPDVVADFSGVQVRQVGPDRVQVSGAGGRPAPPTLKVSVGYDDGFIGEGQISYAGPGAVARARLAMDIVRERLNLTKVEAIDLCAELIGVDAVYRGDEKQAAPAPREVRLRIAARTDTLPNAQRIGEEVESLYTNGPAGGGGVTKAAAPVVAIASTVMPRELVRPRVEFVTP